jgi:uncharacterized membrane protein
VSPASSCPTLPYYLELTCGQIRRYGRDEPTILNSLLRMLRDVAAACRDDHQRADVAGQCDLILAELSEHLIKHDTEQVFDMADRVRQALAGDIHQAYLDRSGESRSI